MRFVSGLPETECGGGSTLAATANIRGVLPELLERLGVGTLLDAPCGDFNYLAATDLGAVHYVGVDVFPDHIARAKERLAMQPRDLAPRTAWFYQADILETDLPRCDAVLAHDFFQHLPTADCLTALAKFRATGARWLLATQFWNSINEDIPDRGMFRFVNLTAAPFGLPQPVEVHPDPPGSQRVLAVFELNPSEGGSQ